MKKIDKYCSKIIHRENYGLDFASYKLGLLCANENKTEYDGILLVNDSVLGPLSSLRDIFSKIENTKMNVLGLTDSYQLSYHLQSYFIYFPSKVFFSRPFAKFFNRIKALGNKDKIIEKYELGLSAYLLSIGVTLEACFPYEILARLAKEKKTDFEFHEKLNDEHSINPSLYFWDILFYQLNFPFIKRELFTKNVINSTKINEILFAFGNSNIGIQKSISDYIKRTNT